MNQNGIENLQYPHKEERTFPIRTRYICILVLTVYDYAHIGNFRLTYAVIFLSDI